MSGSGRNTPCPCGSGKKFKHCCLGKEEQPGNPFSKYSTREVLKVLAVLQAELRNHGKNIRIDLAIQEVLRYRNNGVTSPDLKALRKDLKQNIVPHQFEDPPEEFFTEILYWQNGNNLVFPGIASDGVGIVQLLLNAIRYWNQFPKPFLDEVVPVINLLLSIHTRIALTCNYSHRLFADEHHESLYIPEDQVLLRRKQLFSFPVAGMSKMLAHFGVSQANFDLFILQPEQQTFSIEDIDDNPLFRTPFVIIGNEYVLANPAAQLFAMSEFINDMADKHKAKDILLQLCEGEMMMELYPSFRQMGWREIEFSFPKDETIPKLSRWTELLFKVDDNKLAYVAAMTEIPGSRTYSKDSMYQFTKEMQTRVEKVVAQIRSQFPDHEVLFLNLLQKTKILSKVSFALNLLTGVNYHLFMSAEELHLLTRKYKLDELALWKYAKYLHEYENVYRFAPANSHLAKMEYYRNQDESFYHSDEDRRIGLIGFELQSEVRRTAIELIGKKALPYWGKHGIQFIPCYRKEEHYPVYVSQDINRGLLVNCLDKYSCPIWVMSSKKGDFHGDVYLNGVLYWLNEMSELASPWLNTLGKSPINIVVQLDEKLYELGQDFIPENGPIHFGYRIAVEERRIDITVPSSLRDLLCTAGNEGERVLMMFILDAIGDLQKQLGTGDKPDEQLKQAILSSIMPPGPKKFINTITDYRDLTMNPIDTDSGRYIPKADVSFVLHNQLTWLGPPDIPKEKIKDRKVQTALLNRVVLLHYSHLKDHVKQYNGTQLLMRLMRRQESILQDRAHRKVTYPVQDATLGHYYNVFDKFYETEKDSNMANLALRTIIEWTACWMPEGKKQASQDDIDLMLSRVAQVLNYGTLSDEVHYGLRQVELSRLPSGRLGVDRSKTGLFHRFR